MSTDGQQQNVVLEASTQTPTNEDSDSPVFTKNGQMHKSANHYETALSNIYKMRQTKQVIYTFLNKISVVLFSTVHNKTANSCYKRKLKQIIYSLYII